MISCKRLWIGTGNGVIISIPLTESGFLIMNLNLYIYTFTYCKKDLNKGSLTFEYII